MLSEMDTCATKLPLNAYSGSVKGGKFLDKLRSY
jgi:hypothetical protein